jgi:predicted patatin/cPLA2 family phospholipase
MLEKLWESAQVYHEQVSLLEGMAQKKPPEAFVLCPDRMPPARFITRDKRKINRTIDMGYREAMKQIDEIMRFLDGSRGE